MVIALRAILALRVIPITCRVLEKLGGTDTYLRVIITPAHRLKGYLAYLKACSSLQVRHIYKQQKTAFRLR
jgi:hypothetical protein